MNREILFRAKHIHEIPGNGHLDGTWVHGYLSDKNGKKIFEGDILRYADEIILKTVWNDRKYGFAAQCVKGSVLLKDCKWGLWEFESDEAEVIGNIFDNPELLKGEENGCN